MNVNIFYQEEVAHLMRKDFEEDKSLGTKRVAFPGVTYRTDIEGEGFPLLTLLPVEKTFIEAALQCVAGRNEIGQRWEVGSQLDGTLKCLRHDPSYTNVLVTWDVWSDNFYRVKDRPTHCASVFSIIGGRLHATHLMRSVDMIDAFGHTVATLALVQLIIAQELGVKPGVLTYTMAHPYIRLEDELKTKDILRQNVIESLSKTTVELPERVYERARYEFESLPLLFVIGKTAQQHT